MDAFFIVNSKNSDILISKEFKENQNSLKLGLFIMELDSIIKCEQSPYLMIKNTVFIYLKEGPIIYLGLTSEDVLISSIYNILENINTILLQAFDNNLSADLLRDNFVEITLMIDQYLLSGVPVLSDSNALSALVSPYKLKDKISEKFIGKAKEYDTRTLLNYIRESQISYDNYKYYNENIKNNYEVLFHYVDNLELTCDRYFNQLNKNMSTEIEVFSQIPYNIDLNLLLNIPFNVFDFSVDEGVSTKKSDILKKKNIDCLIKHGSYKLIQFIPNITTKIILPFKIIINTNWTNNNFSLNLQVELDQVKELIYPMEDVEIRIFFPEGFQNSNLSVNVGDFEFSGSKSDKVSAKWMISKLEKGNSAILKGNLIGENNGFSNCVMLLSCKIDKFSISGGSVTKGTITKNPKNMDISKKSRNFTIVKNLEIIF
jgi:hypothetical protein